MSDDNALAAIKASGCVTTRPLAELSRDLIAFEQMLIKWQKVQNLVAGNALADFWPRHVADSLQVTRYMPEGDYAVCDIGSGGGFPALPLAMALKDRDVQFHLVESNSRKVAFLRAVSREMGLKVTVHDSRIENFVSRETPRFALFTARALAPLTVLNGFIAPIWAQNSRALFLKGREHVEECAESGERWRHNVVIHNSQVDSAGVVLELMDLAPLTD